MIFSIFIWVLLIGRITKKNVAMVFASEGGYLIMLTIKYLYSMKKMILVFISAFVFFISNAQSEMIKDAFRRLPDGKAYKLTLATRDSMLEGKTYYPADNDSNETVAYNYGVSEFVKDYLYVSMSFETGQRATGMIEIRNFKLMNGNNMILVSKTGGVPGIVYSQQSIDAFIYEKNKPLTPYKKKILPGTDESMFMKPGIPDSVKKEILNNSNMTFDLSNEKLMLSLASSYISNKNELRKWLKGDTVYFDWIKDHFVISKMEFQY